MAHVEEIDATIVSGATFPPEDWTVDASGKTLCHGGVLSVGPGVIRHVAALGADAQVLFVSLDEATEFRVRAVDRDDDVDAGVVRLRPGNRPWLVEGTGSPGRVLVMHCVDVTGKALKGLAWADAPGLPCVDRPLVQMAGALVSLAKDIDAHGDSIEHLVRALVAHLVGTRGADPANAQRRQEGLAAWQVRRATDLMLSRLSERVSLPEIASACGLSPSYFSRLFKVSTGLSTYQWLLDQRIERAKTLLADTTLPLCEVAYACGFSDQTHFTRAFSRRVRTTPLVWRREATCDHADGENRHL
ncbi:AraC family transcriptional regulator [Luteibacter sp. 3190]|uniref:helix-turn-helix domain-containing protein n=1 Tax=Luteibacter sp. 3190 TaxID=2817736 RepID=UPI002860B41C|nr:AraC family transcriptional regulator [Luteibacter sp. 3190]MDR6936252.1 AraC-like DNA-binding protein [Luteibacter sp. 3190]